MINSKKMDTRKLTQLSILVAIEAIMAFVPILGSIPLGPIVATTAHIPVIIAAVTMGVGAGAFMGFIFGLFSFIVHSFVAPSITSFVFTPIVSVGNGDGSFWSLVICFVPRILLGVCAALLYQWFSSIDKKDRWSYIAAGAISSMIHTLLVLGGIFIFFKDSYSETIGKAADLLLGLIGLTILTNGIPEAILAAIVTVAVAVPIKKVMKKTVS
ncbi:MAG: ECF transporter S component [Oscillospiraceae bacterium]